MKTLFNISLQMISRNLDLLTAAVALPLNIREWLLQFLSSHDQLLSAQTVALLANPVFAQGLERLNFYLSEELNDDHLEALGKHAKNLTQVTIVHCPCVGDAGVRAVTAGQRRLRKLELRGQRRLTSDALAELESPVLEWLDLSDCRGLDSEGLLNAIQRCGSNVEKLFLNHCGGLEDVGIAAIGATLGTKLRVLELDFLGQLADPASVINFVSQHCPNLVQLSLCRYFDADDSDFLNLECNIMSNTLRELDLYGNYFSVLPKLPDSISSIRLSCTGMENVEDLVSNLTKMRQLRSVRLLLSAKDDDNNSVRSANEFLQILLGAVGDKMTALQIEAHCLNPLTSSLLVSRCTRLTSLVLDVVHVDAGALHAFLMAEETQRALLLKTIKLTRLHLPQKVLISLARYARNLEELELSQMRCVDDRFLGILANNAPKLRSLNVNGCPFVTDRGLILLARHCPLKEVRVRATGVSDVAVYVLAQFCSDLEWISHADFSGRPKFSDTALQALRDSCVNRVIC